MNRTQWIILGLVVAILVGVKLWILFTTDYSLCRGFVQPKCAVSQSTVGPTVTATVSNLDNGTTINLKVGERVAIKLDTLSDGGYQSTLDRYDQVILRLDQHERIEPTQTNSPTVGASLFEEWIFTTLEPGTTTVELTNFRSFGPRPEKPTFVVTIEVE